MQSTRKALARILAVGIVLATPMVAAIAQEPKPAEQGDETRPIPLPEERVVAPPLMPQSPYVVPTETRTGTPVRDLPESITVVPRAIIDEQKASTLDEVLRNVSGIAPQAGRGFNDDFVIRGFRPAEGSLFLRDQFPQAPDDLSPFAELWNVERVEVLKGPKAFLYGRSEPGGIVNLVTKKPLFEPYYAVQVDIGSSDLYYRGAFDISGPLLGKDGPLAYRLGALYQESGSFREVVEGTRAFVAPALTWKLTPDTTVTVQGEYLDHERTRDTGLVAIGNRPARIPIETFLNDSSDRVEVDAYRAGYELVHRFTEDWRLRNASRFLRLEGGFVGTSVGTPDAAGNATRSLGGFDDIVNQSYAMQTEVTGRFRTGPLEHRPLFGVEVVRALFDGDFVSATGPVPGINIFDPIHTRPLPGVRPVASWEIRHDTLGAYLQDEIRITDAWRLIGGGRFDVLREKDVDPTTGSVRRSEDFTSVSPRAGLVFQPVKALSFYGAYSESFQPVGGTNPDGQGFESVRGVGYEGGAKVELLEGRLATTLAVYHITKENVPNPDPVRPNFRVQTGEERSRGVEAELAGTIMRGWDVIGSYGYTDARVTEDTVPARVGRRKPNVPEHAASLWTRYTFLGGPLRGLGVGGGIFYVGERTGDAHDTYRLPGYVRLDALIAYRFDRLRASLNFQNVTDETYYVSGGNRNSVFPGEPFGVVGSLAYEF